MPVIKNSQYVIFIANGQEGRTYTRRSGWAVWTDGKVYPFWEQSLWYVDALGALSSF